jgi:hypothetical protein
MRTVHRSIATCLAVACAAAGALAVPTRNAEAQVSVGGVVYIQNLMQLAKDTLTADSAIQHISNFDVTRAYLNVTGRFPGGIATRVTADLYNSGGAGGLHAFRLKYAYVAWTPEHSPLTYKIGQMHTPFIDWEEALWDYRMQGTMPMERNGYMSSSDFGMGVDGKFDADRFNFQVGLYNGENYSGALGDQRKDLMARASYRLMTSDDGSRVGGLRVTAYGSYGAPSSGGRRQRLIGMVSYKSTNLTLAGEFGLTRDSTTGGNTAVGGSAVATAPLKSGRLMSAYGVFHFPRTRFALLGRVDIVDPQTDSTAAAPGTNDRLTRVIGGISYQLSPNLRLLADVDAVSYQSGFTPTPASYAAYANRTTGYLHAQFTF